VVKVAAASAATGQPAAGGDRHRLQRLAGFDIGEQHPARRALVKVNKPGNAHRQPRRTIDALVALRWCRPHPLPCARQQSHGPQDWRRRGLSQPTGFKSRG